MPNISQPVSHREKSYADVAPSATPQPTISRIDRILFYLRHAEEPMTAKGLADHMNRNRPPGGFYPYSLCCDDLRRLERFHLARSIGHPKRWSAVL